MLEPRLLAAMVLMESWSGLTSGMPLVLPETDLVSIRVLCEARVPPEARAARSLSTRS